MGNRHQWRFFLDRECIEGDTVVFPAAQIRQLRNVLRARPGDRVIVLDGTRAEYVVQLVDASGHIMGRVVEWRENSAEPLVDVHLFQALLKFKKLEVVVQKCVEVGVSRITPMVCSRSVPGGTGDRWGDRLRDIAREAAEQSGRGILPRIREIQTFAHALRAAPTTSLIFAAPNGLPAGLSLVSLDEALPAAPQVDVGIFVGPEGGFTADELESATAMGFTGVTLGPRTLRAETAAIVASSLVIHHLERFVKDMAKVARPASRARDRDDGRPNRDTVTS